MLVFLYDITQFCSAKILGRIGILIYITVISPLALFAQKDSTFVENFEDNTDYRTISFAPDQLWEQKRYTPQENDSVFYNSSFWRRFYFGVGGGIQGLSDNIGSVHHASIDAFLGYKFTPIHSLRLRGSMINYSYNQGKKSAKSIGMGIDYLANLSNFAWGYNLQRTFDVSTVLGAGLRYNSEVLGSRIVPYAHIGLSANIHLSSNFAFFLEPYVGLQKGMDVLFARSNPEKWNLMYGFSGGLQVALNKRKDSYLEADSIYRKFFFDSSIGLALPLASGSVMKLSGTSYQVALGMWMNPMFGLRFGAHAQSAYWNATMTSVSGVPVRISNSQAIMGGRAEVMLNPLNFSKKWRDNKEGHDFGLNVLMGADFGWNMKSGVANTTSGPFRCYYYGVTGALQFQYRIAKPGTYIYFEPRYLAAMYNVPYQNTHNSLLTTEHSMSLNVGTRIYITNPTLTGAGSDEFTPHWWAGFDFGGVKTQHLSTLHKQGGLGLNPSVSMSWGYDWKPLASFRAQLAYQRLTEHMVSSYSGYNAKGQRTEGSGLWENGYNVMDLRLGYMLNVNNFLQGYNADRKFNLWLIAGPTLSWIMSEDNKWNEDQKGTLRPLSEMKLSNSYAGHVSPAVTASMMASLKVAKNVDVTAEVLGQYNFIRNTNPGDHSLFNNIKYGVSVGARYHFDDEMLKNFFSSIETKPWQKGWFVDAAYGWAIPTDGGLGLHGSGSSMQISLGYWFNSLLGAKLGIVGQQTYWGKTDVPGVKEPVSGLQVHSPYSIYKSQLMLGGCAELLLNPLNLLSSRKNSEEAPRFDMNMSLGMNFGGMVKVQAMTRGYIGFTSALTALYRLSNTMQIYLEPRYDVFNYSAYNSALKYEQAFSDKMFTISIGARITRPTGESKESKRLNDREKMSHRGFWVGASIGGSKMIQTLRNGNGGIGIQPSVGLIAGYDFDRLNTIRAHVSYDIHSRYRTEQPYSVVTPSGINMRYIGAMNSTYHQFDLRMLYMLNITNLWTGYDKRNVFNMYLELGPSFSSIMAESNSLAEGEYQGGDNFKYVGREFAGNTSMGMVAGIIMALKLTPKWDLTAELMGQYHFNRLYMPENYAKIINGIKMDFSVGTRYNF